MNDEHLQELRDILRGQEYPHREELEEAMANSARRLKIDGTAHRSRAANSATHYLRINEVRQRLLSHKQGAR